MRGRSENVPSMIRAWSETVPRPFPSVRNPPRNRGYFSCSGLAFCIEKCNISSSGYLSKFHQVLRLPRKVTLQLHQVLRLPRKVTLELRQVLRLPRKVPLELHQVLRLPRKVTLDLHQVLHLPRKVTLDLHQVLRLPHRMTRMLDPRHIWTSFPMRGATNVTLQTHQILRLPRKMDHPTSGRNLRKTAETSFPMRGRSENVPSMIRAWSETVPRPFPSVRNPPRNRGYFSRSGLAFCIEKCNISSSGYLSKFHQVLRLPRKVTLQLHQVLRLPRKVTLELHQVLHLPRKVTLDLHQVLHLPRKVTLDLHQVLHLPRKVTLDLHQVLRLPHRTTRMLDPRHIWTSFPMRGATNVTLQTHQILRLPRKMTIQHLAEICGKQLKRHFQCAADPRMFRAWSEHDPSMIRDRSETVPVSPQPATQQRLLFALRTSILYWKMQHFELRLSFQISPSPAPATQSDTSTSPSTAPTTKSDTWTSPSTAPTTKSDTSTSPSTAPATKSDTWLPRKVTLDLHQVLRLPHRLTRMLDPRHIWTSTAPATTSDTSTSPSTAPTTKSDTWTSPSTAPATKSDTWLYYYSAILLLLLLLSDYSVTLLSAIRLLDSTITQRFNYFYYSAILLIDSTITQRFY